MDVKTELFNLVQQSAPGFVAAFGGLVSYIYKWRKEGKQFRVAYLLVSGLLAFMVGNILGYFIPDTVTYKPGLVMMAGFYVYPILDVFGTHVEDAFKRVLTKHLP